MSASPSRPSTDPTAIALRGLHLIEASAGTGKTYAIVHLVLRLLLESGLGIEQVLVLTFTEAATQELRDRIGQRLRKARAVLAGEPADDPLLAALIAARPDRTQAGARLDRALADLDRAAVYTIHGFCHRVLQDFAFESGAPFDAELITDELELRRAAAEDWWRRRMGAADRDEAAWLLAALPKGPASLLERLGPYLGAAAPEPVGPDAHALERDLSALEDLHGRLSETWPRFRGEIADILTDNPGLKANVYSRWAVCEALLATDALCAGPLPAALPDRFELLTPEKLGRSARKGREPPDHPVFELCGELADLGVARIAAARRAALLADALGFLKGELARRKRERRVLYFDDLLEQAAEALAGPRGPTLAARLRTAYPQALIDEFQDTDHLQYRIVQAIYGDQVRDPGETDPLGLYLIGDPKQAIYGFRGADIFAYIGARRQAAREGQVHTLDTNRRSASGLVRAVNRVFARAHRPFVFDDDIPFSPVEPGPDADREILSIGGQPATPLVFRWLPLQEDNCTRNGKRILAEPARAAAAADCARDIAALLAEPARLGDRDLRAGDIAVLVRSHREGRTVRDALALAGIGSVAIGQETVFASEESEDLAALLAALSPGAGDGALRAALATRLLGWTAAELGRTHADPEAWERALAAFADCRETWRERGFIAAFECLLHGFDVPARLRRGPDGERRLTDLLHLAELAQAASRDRPGPQGLARWLADRRADPKAGGEGALLRLESDGNLVQVVTFHKSKGLEYPVVYLPFPWSGGPGLGKTDPFCFHDRETLAARLDLGSPDDEDNRSLWEEEDLAERLRLLYVALTRAKRRCVLYWGAVNGAEHSAAAHLLHGGGEGVPACERAKGLDEAGLKGDLDELAESAPGCVAVEDTASSDALPRVPAVADTAALEARVFSGAVRNDWRFLSFSGLAAGRAPEQPDPERRDYDALGAPVPAPADGEEPAPAADSREGAGVPTRDGSSGGAPAQAAPAPAPAEPIFRFPRGIRAGHCLHELFERLDFRGADGPALRRAAEHALSRHGLDPYWTDTLAELAARVLDTPLGPQGLRLRGIGPEDRRNELEFHFALEGLNLRALDRVLAAHRIPLGLATGAGAGEVLSGLMKGFMDLVLRHGGRFYILDYKSNHLGDRLDDYGPDGMERAMTEHGYRLQYLIYTVALHRYLRLRLPDYDYERHMGGAIYLFLRGMRPELGDTRGVFRDRPERELIESLDRVFGVCDRRTSRGEAQA